MSEGRRSTQRVVTLADVKRRPEVQALITAANECLKVLGYTEHGLRHVGFVSVTTANILRLLGYDARMVELGAIAGWVHDVGNAINRDRHGITGAAMVYEILLRMGMPVSEVCLIIGAVGNHEEQNGTPVNPVSAALILADKADAHRTRVRMDAYDPTDIHDRVNFSIKKNVVTVEPEKRVIRLKLIMDNTSSVMDYLKIYLTRMALSEQSAAFLGCKYELVINNTIINNHNAKPVAQQETSTTEIKASDEE
ncbi:MAG: HD domain-containing protein [Clostridiales bacterium]|jgi:metal-dependent HD superfamily phosphatase/phosphodiesterase|nr:HD domain-containing protein [Clostridiales bacterium]